MSRNFVRPLLVAFGLAIAILSSASAQHPRLNVKLGLWEATTVAQTSGTMPFDTSGMTEEQRARMAGVMDKMQKQMAMPHTIKTCVTREKLEKDPFENKNQNCKNTVVSSSANAYDVKFECGQGGETQTGEWRFEAENPELVKGTGQMTFERGGRKMTSNTSMTAKWIGAECGDVK